MKSTFAVGNKARGSAQNIAARAERFQRTAGIFHELCELRVRAIAAEDGDERRLARRVVFSRAFAKRCRVAFGIEQVVGDLEGKPQVIAIGLEGCTFSGARAPQDGARFHSVCDQRSGFHRLQPADVGGRWYRRLAAFVGLQVQGLTTHHAACSRRAGQREHKACADGWVDVRFRPGEDVEGERQQAVTGKDRRPVVEGAMHGRAATAGIVVVHGGKIVMDQRITVQELETRRRIQRFLRRQTEQACCLNDQKRAEALSPAEHGMAHGSRQPVWRGCNGAKICWPGVVEVDGKPGLDEVSCAVEPFDEHSTWGRRQRHVSIPVSGIAAAAGLEVANVPR